MSDFKDKIKTFNNDDYLKREQQRIYNDYLKREQQRIYDNYFRKSSGDKNYDFFKQISPPSNASCKDLYYSMKTYVLNGVYLYLMQNRDKWSIVFNQISCPIPANKTIDEKLETILNENGIEIEKGNYVFYIKDSI